MASANSRVVRKSAEMLEYGENCTYNESMKMPGLFSSVITVLALGFFVAMAYLPVTNRIVRWLLPSPGQGPSEEKRNKSWFKYHIVAEAEDKKRVDVAVSGGDPGYSETAKMLAESALTLALDREELPGQSGFHTSASGLGNFLIDRLNQNGITFKLLD